MAKLFDEIDDSLRAFIEAQAMFFVATAPSSDGGHVNLSPKGGATCSGSPDRSASPTST